MSTLFFEDTVAFRDDTQVIGTIDQTWSDIDPLESQSLISCYVHKDLPPKVRKTWFSEGRLLSGYVIVAFMQTYDGHALVSEQSLLLLDRSLAAGDVVKKTLSDAHSGTVISTSLLCSLQPLCSEKDYLERHQRQVHGHYPTHGPYAAKRNPQHQNSHGFPCSNTIGQDPVIDDKRTSCLQVPAGQLTHWHNYREQDFVIYNNWVGQVKSVYDEVTIRLGNGSVVVVEDPNELEEPYFIPGTKSFELAQRLDRAGFYKHYLARSPMIGKPQSHHVDTSYPGQEIQTKKGNLRRGRWKFGAYDPNVPPRGIVVDVRCIQLEVKWIYPNQSVPMREQVAQPADLLETDELSSGEVMVYNRSRVPRNGPHDQFSNASYGPDTGFGNKVRFRDVAGAAIKYESTPMDPEILKPASEISELSVAIGDHSFEPSEKLLSQGFERIPRTATQGFDLNVLQVTGTSTKALVRWQDCTCTVEESNELYPYLNNDEHDVWPGDKVSFKPDEEQLYGNNLGAVRVHKAGVVQSVDAIARIAIIRWYQGAQIDIETNNDDMTKWQSSGLWYGRLGSETSEVPLYDLAAYPAININRADGAIILPKSHPSVIRSLGTSGLLSAGIGRALDFLGMSATQSLSNEDSLATRQLLNTDFAEVDWDDITWCGEIIDLCLDGDVTVRLGAAAEVRDIKLPPERILVVGLEDVDSESDSTDEDDASAMSDDISVNDFEADDDTDEVSVDAIKYSIEYDGDKPADADSESMWTTDEEDDQDSARDNIQPDRVFPPDDSAKSRDRPLETKLGTSIVFGSYASMPVQFALLDDTPTDHHYLNTQHRLNASVVRRISKENEILQRSLPDGVFVRGWDSRFDLLRVLIVGPQDTPYEFAPFVIDLQYGSDFPNAPPNVFFHSWTGNLGRINPNLYEDGKICLSLLGTWDADEKNEAWSPKKSTILQIIVSLMGLVLVREPYYNEAGFDVLIGSEDSRIPSQLYTEKVHVLSKAFIKTALTSPPQGLEDVIKWLYLTSTQPSPHLLRRVVKDSESSLAKSHCGMTVNGARDMQNEDASGRPNLSAGALVLLKRNLVWLKDLLERDEGN